MTRIHRKTRTGCAQCKRRRVKCDERKPACANCHRNDLHCSLEFLTPLNSISRHQKMAHISPSKTSSIRGYPFTPSMSPELPLSPFDTQTNELLHHYTTTLYITLAGNRVPTVWRISMPQLGLSYPFLLSGILAVSALHLSSLLPHRKHELQTLAVAQECAALPSFRHSMKSPNADSIHAIFAFAGSVVPYILASPKVQHGEKVDRCRLPHRDDQHPHWFQAMRGLMVLFANHFLELEKGPFAQLLRGDPGPNYASDNPDDEHLAKLEGMFPLSLPLFSPLTRPLSPFDSSQSTASSKEERNMEVCKEALNELRRVSALPYSRNKILCIKTAVHIFPGSVNQDFIELVYERDPRALVLFAHYCVLLKRGNHVWHLKGLGVGMLENIWKALDEKWRPWIQWAIDQPEL